MNTRFGELEYRVREVSPGCEDHFDNDHDNDNESRQNASALALEKAAWTRYSQTRGRGKSPASHWTISAASFPEPLRSPG